MGGTYIREKTPTQEKGGVCVEERAREKVGCS